MLRPVRSLLAGLALVSVLAACSATAAAPAGVATLASQAASADGSAAPSASLDPEAAKLAFAQCMREQGVDMPDPQSGPNGGFGFTIGGDGSEPGELEAAMEACDHFLEDAEGERRELDPEMLDRMVDFAACMREHGIDMPDPQVDGGRIMVKGNVKSGDGGDGGDDGGPQTRANVLGIDPSSPEFQEAQEACRPILGDSFKGPEFQGGAEPAKP